MKLRYDIAQLKELMYVKLSFFCSLINEAFRIKAYQVHFTRIPSTAFEMNPCSTYNNLFGHLTNHVLC